MLLPEPDPIYKGAWHFTIGLEGNGNGAGGVGKGGGSQGEDLSLKDVMREIQSLSLDVKSKFGSLERQLGEQAKEFKDDLGKIREELISRSQFEVLQGRVEKLESGGLSEIEISWFQQQVNWRAVNNIRHFLT